MEFGDHVLRVLDLGAEGHRVRKCQDQSGGCINRCFRYTIQDTSSGLESHYFVKVNQEMDVQQACSMFQAEAYGLSKMRETNTVHVPRAMYAGELRPGIGAIVMEHIEISGSLNQQAQGRLGNQLAEMHLFSAERLGEREFGFAVDNFSGETRQLNTERTMDWVAFYREHRLQYQLNLPQAKRSTRLQELASRLLPKIGQFFDELSEPIRPALIHGDLWGGNAGSLKSDPSMPVLYDPAPYFAHSEMELSIMGMFGGFGKSFYDAYHQLIPQQPEFHLRQRLYQLYHYLNHLNIFGNGYLGNCLCITEELLEHAE